MGASPVPVNSAFGNIALEALPEIVEDGELILGEKAGVRLGVELVVDLGDCIFEVRGDTGIEIALGVARDVNGSLVGQRTNPVDAGGAGVVGVAAHC